MQDVTCFHCGNTASISPDRSLCAVCGEDLQHLLAPDYVADHFYRRAQAFAVDGQCAAALAETERGLTYAATAELHLLAAILAQQVGRFDLMRRHVASIGVDDSLRPEAEWLLRAHQARQRALREGGRVQGPASPSFLDELLGRGGPGVPPARALGPSRVRPGMSLAAVVALIVLVYIWINPPPLPVEHSTAANDPGPTLPAEADGDAPAAGVDAATESAPFLLPTPTPTPIGPAGLAQTAEQIADTNPRRVVIIPANPFALGPFLRDMGHPELAVLSVDARMQGKTLILQGIVHLDKQRRTLIELARQAPDVEDVNAVDLLLRPLPTYTVQEGDTLWSIVFDIFGDDVTRRVDELFELNRDVLPSPDALRPGMDLKVPPL